MQNFQNKNIGEDNEILLEENSNNKKKYKVSPKLLEVVNIINYMANVKDKQKEEKQTLDLEQEENYIPKLQEEKEEERYTPKLQQEEEYNPDYEALKSAIKERLQNAKELQDFKYTVPPVSTKVIGKDNVLYNLSKTPSKPITEEDFGITKDTKQTQQFKIPDYLKDIFEKKAIEYGFPLPEEQPYFDEKGNIKRDTTYSPYERQLIRFEEYRKSKEPILDSLKTKIENKTKEIEQLEKDIELKKNNLKTPKDVNEYNNLIKTYNQKIKDLNEIEEYNKQIQEFNNLYQNLQQSLQKRIANIKRIEQLEAKRASSELDELERQELINLQRTEGYSVKDADISKLSHALRSFYNVFPHQVGDFVKGLGILLRYINIPLPPSIRNSLRAYDYILKSVGLFEQSENDTQESDDLIKSKLNLGKKPSLVDLIKQASVSFFKQNYIENQKDAQIIIKIGDLIKSKLDLATNPYYEEDFLTSYLPQAFGSGVLFYGTGLAGQALKLPTYLLPLLTASLPQAAQGYEDAIRHGADEETALKSFLVNLGIGATEVIPVMNLFKRLDKNSGGLFSKLLSKQISKFFREGLEQGFEEFIQEVFQQFAQNANAKILYNASQDLFENLDKGGAAGLITGFFFGASGAKLQELLESKNISESDKKLILELKRLIELKSKLKPIDKKYKPLETEKIEPKEEINQLQEEAIKEENKKRDTETYNKLTEQLKQAKSKNELVDLGAIRDIANNIQTQEIRTKIETLLKEAEEHNNKLIEKNQLTLENLSKIKYGTTDLNSLTEDQRIALINEYNEMKNQGITEFKQLKTTKPTIEEKEYAIQKPSTEEILQRQQEEVGGTRGERGGMESRIEGIETSRESKPEIQETKEEEVKETTTQKQSEEDIEDIKQEKTQKTITEEDLKYIKRAEDKFYIRTEDGFEEVKGKPVRLNKVDGDYFIFKSKDGSSYIVAEDKSGFIVSEGKTIDDAIGSAEAKLSLIGKYKLEEITKRNILEYGLSPRYTIEKPKYNRVSDKFYIWTKDGFKEVEGQRINLVYEGDFFLHKSKENDGKTYYVISEGKTGYYISKGLSKNEVIQDSNEKLRRMGRKGLKEIIEKRIQEFGLSPRYTMIEEDESNIERKTTKEETKNIEQQKSQEIVKSNEIIELRKVSDKYYFYNWNTREFEEVEGKPIKLDIEGDFFIYKTTSGLYRIVEANTGLLVADGSTRKEAINEANQKLKEFGQDKFKISIAGATTYRYSSPRYKIVKVSDENVEGQKTEDTIKRVEIDKIIKVQDKYYAIENYQYKEVKGESVKLDIDGDFFVYENDEGYYKVVEGITGRIIIEYAFSKEEAIKKANEFINKNGKQKIENIINSFIIHNVISPRYKLITKGEGSVSKEKIKTKKTKKEKVKTTELQKYTDEQQKKQKTEEEKTEEIISGQQKGEKQENIIEESKNITETKPQQEQQQGQKQEDIIDDEMRKLIEDIAKDLGISFQLKKPSLLKKVFQLKPGRKIPADTQIKAINLIEKFIEKGKYKFNDIFLAVRQAFGEKFAKEILPALKVGYTAYLTMADEEISNKMDSFDYVKNYEYEDIKETKTISEEKDTTNQKKKSFIERIREEIKKGNVLNKTQLEKIANEYGITDANLAKELSETAVVIEAREIINNTDNEIEVLEKLIDLYNKQPYLTHRTSETVSKQQYSTPVPIAYIAGLYVKDGIEDRNVLEPTAGNGLFTIVFDKKQVYANEIDPVRYENLKLLDFAKISNEDALENDNLFNKKFDGIITNPPFGKISPKLIDNYKITKLEHILAVNALNQMKDNGRAAIIIGGHNQYDEKGRLERDRTFFNWLYHYYNVQAVFNIDGKVYNKQGTTFPIRLILINGRKANPEGSAPLFNAKKDKVISDFKELYDKVKEVRNEAILQSEVNAIRGFSSSPDMRSSERYGVRETRGTETISTESTGKPDGEKRAGFERTAVYTGEGSGSVESNIEKLPGSSGDVIGESVLPSSIQQGSEGSGRRIEPRRSEDDIRGAFVGGHTSTTIRANLETENLSVPYKPQSKGIPLETHIPRNMAFETRRQLEMLEQEVGGDIDQFVVNKLGYESKEELYKYLSAEQIDAVALAITNIEKGQGMIIGDMAGIGKGRIAASVIRYAILNGYKPIFLTEKARLFSDLYRDMNDTGNAHYKPFIINSSDDADITDIDGNVVYKRLSNKELNKYLKEHSIGDADYIVATYSQFQSEKYVLKRNFLSHLAEDNIIVMDESHNASGQGSNTYTFFNKIVKDARAVVYLSATFAKTPQNMPIYTRKTAIQEANLSDDELIYAITKGGIALQEIMSADLVEARQMIRREKSYEGIEVEYKIIESEKEKYAKIVDSITEIMRDIIKFQREHIEPVVDMMDDDIKMEGRLAGLTKSSNLGVFNTPFASKVYQVIDQLLFSLKAEQTAQEAIEQIKQGYKPVIAIKNTMESFLQYINANVGDKFESTDFSAVLEKGLISVMRVRINTEQGKPIYDQIKFEDLTEEGQKEYNRILQKIKETTTGITISPIDQIIYLLNKEGIKVAEATGRKIRLKYNDDGTAEVVSRTEKEKLVNNLYREFNNWENPGQPRGEEGYKDIVLIVNAASSTGSSAHASEIFKDKRPRVMITTQIELNINTEVQKRGRINRTGQVVKPKYITLASPIPAEQRLLMMAKRKLKSLDANIASEQKKADQTFQVEDFLNKYGDRIVIEYLKENRELNDMLLDPFNFNKMESNELDKLTYIPGAAQKITGSVALLPTRLQEEFYNEIISRYNDYINHLNSIGENDLEVKILPLQAKTLSTSVFILGKEGNSPFGKDTILETVEVNVLRKPLKKAQIDEIIKTYLNGETPESKKEKIFNNFIEFWRKFENEQLDRIKNIVAKELNINPEIINRSVLIEDIIEKYPHLYESVVEEKLEKYWTVINYLSDLYRKIWYALDKFKIGDVYKVPLIKDEISSVYSNAIFLGWKINEKRKNPYSPSAVILKFAVNDSRRIVEIPASKIEWLYDIRGYWLDESEKTEILTNWDKLIPQTKREIRQILTGNILQAYGEDIIKGGQLITYNTIDNKIKRGILLNKNIEQPEKEIKVPIKRAIKLLKNLSPYKNILTSNNEVQLQKYGETYEISVPASKKVGGKYYLNEKLANLMNERRFDKIFNWMRGEFSADKLEEVVDILQKEYNLSIKITSEELKKLNDNDISYQLKTVKAYKDDFGNQVPHQFVKIHEYKLKHPILKDKKVEFAEPKVVYWTREQIKSYGYSDSFIETLPKLKEGDFGYEPGKEKFAVEIAEATIRNPQGSEPAIIVSSTATPSAYTEGIIHTIYFSLEKENPELLRRIQKWEELVREEAKKYGIDIPEGYETFAQAMIFRHLGYADENPDIAELLEIPKDILDDFYKILNLGEIPVDAIKGQSYRKSIRLAPDSNSLLNFRNKKNELSLPEGNIKHLALGLEIYTKLKQGNIEKADIYPEWRKMMKTNLGIDIKEPELREIWKYIKQNEETLKSKISDIKVGNYTELTPKQILMNPQGIYPTPIAIKDAKSILGDKFNTEFNKYKEQVKSDPELKPKDKTLEEGLLLESFARRVVAAHRLGINDIGSDLFNESILWDLRNRVAFQLKGAHKRYIERIQGTKLTTEEARERGEDSKEYAKGNIVDLGIGLKQAFGATIDRILNAINRKNLERELGINYDPRLKKLYREFITAPVWFFDKEPQLRRVWDIIDRHFVRNVNEDTAYLKEEVWDNGKAWRDLSNEEKKEFLDALEDYEFIQYRLQQKGEPLELLFWEDFVKEYKLSSNVEKFFLFTYRPVFETALEMVKDVDRYKIINATPDNPYLDKYFYLLQNKVDEDQLKAELERAKKEIFNDDPNFEFYYEQELLKMKEQGEEIDEAKALNLAWKNNIDARERLAEALISKKYAPIEGKVYFPSTRFDKKYYLYATRKPNIEEQLIQNKGEDKFFTTEDSLIKLKELKKELEKNGFKVKIGKFKEAGEEIVENVLTEADVLDLAIASGIENENPVIEKLIKTIRAKGFTRHFIHKKYIPGFDYNTVEFEKAIYNYINAVSLYKNRTIGGLELDKTIKQLKAQGILKHNSSQENYIRSLRNKIENSDVKVSQLLRAIASIYYLSLSPAYLSQQIIQPLNTLLPYLPIAAKELNLDTIEAEKSFGEALATSLQYWAWKVYDKLNRIQGKLTKATFGLDKEFLEIIRSLERQGVGKPLRSMELTGQEVDPKKHYITGLLDLGIKPFRWLATIVSIPGIAVEDFTRTIGIRAYYLLGKKAGLKGDELEDFISTNIAKSYGTASGRLSKPPGYYIAGKGKIRPLKKALQAIIESWLTFKNFAFMNYGQWGKVWRSLRKDNLLRPIIYKLGAQIGLGGLKYMMWTSSVLTLMSLIYGIFDIPKDPEEQYEKLFLNLNKLIPGLGDAFYRGIASITFKVDLSTLFAQTSPIEEPFSNSPIEFIGGAPASAIMDITHGKAPRVLRGIQREERYKEEGVRLGRRKLIEPKDITEEEMSKIKLGYTPLRISKAYREEEARHIKSMQYTDRIRKIVKKEIIPLIEEGKNKEAREKFRKIYDEMLKNNVLTDNQKKSITGVNRFISIVVLPRLTGKDREIIKKWKNRSAINYNIPSNKMYNNIYKKQSLY